MKELSIFIDESGDFGALAEHSPYYLFTLVFHEQIASISEAINDLDNRIRAHGAGIHAIHTGPLLRREEHYQNWSLNERKTLFSDLFFFALHCPISYHTVLVNKREVSTSIDLIGKLSKSLSDFFRLHLEYFMSFDKIIVYYDNGQTELTKILSSVFNAHFSNVEFRRVFPNDYKLFQVADLICTLELVNIKFEHKNSTKWEDLFFGSYKEFKKRYMKGIRKRKC